MSYVDKGNHTIKIETPPEVAEGNGEAAYVITKTRIKNGPLTRFNIADLALSQMIANPGNTNFDSDKIEKYIDDIFAAYAEYIIDWNWLDGETGQPLPSPSMEILRDELYNHQVEWIRDTFVNFLKYRITEGNARTSSP